MGTNGGRRDRGAPRSITHPHRKSGGARAITGTPTPGPSTTASRSVWFLSGSENHDANQKMANLLALQFLCLHGRRLNGDTKLADGRPARDHYAAWVAYWKEYTRQRAREGLFAEVAQPGPYG